MAIGKLCLVPACETLAAWRGLCSACYQAAQRYVQRGLVTWDALEKQGKILPAREERRKRTVKEIGARARFFLKEEG